MGSSRILIVRTSALGDVVHALPVLTALRRHLREARIGWVVEAPMAPLLERHPDLDELIVVRLRTWRKRPLAAATLREVAAFGAALDRFSADVVLDLMGNHKAGAIAALTLADRRIGLARAHRREPSSALWISEPATPNAGEHAVDRGLAVLAELGLPVEAADFGPARLLAHAPPVVDGHELARAEPYVVLLPGAGWDNKRLPPAVWGAVAAHLGERAGLASWLAPGPREEPLARAAQVASGGWARTVHAGSLAELGAVLRHARLVLGGDTGPLHLAHALGTPVLCVMGPTSPYRTGPYGAPERAIWTELPCSFCGQRLTGIKACMLQIPQEEIVERAVDLLVADTGDANLSRARE